MFVSLKIKCVWLIMSLFVNCSDLIPNCVLCAKACVKSALWKINFLFDVALLKFTAQKTGELGRQNSIGLLFKDWWHRGVLRIMQSVWGSFSAFVDFKFMAIVLLEYFQPFGFLLTIIFYNFVALITLVIKVL